MLRIGTLREVDPHSREFSNPDHKEKELNQQALPAGSFSEKIVFDDPLTFQSVIGPQSNHLKLIEREVGASLHVRGNEVTVIGATDALALVRSLLDQLYTLARRGTPLGSEDVVRATRILRADSTAELKGIFSDTLLVASRHRPITPKGLAQKRYVEAIREHDIVFGIGPAGTGKTYLAMAMAVRALLDKRVKRIVLARPAVEAGEKLGFLPGSMQEKVNPYLRPLYDALHDMMEFERADQLLDKGVIEVAPLAFMRGRTLNDAFVILDEAQNSTTEQMKMFLTRLGFGSKAVITGDVTQIDLPTGARSGLLEARDILAGIEGIRFCAFTDIDVVRHPLVQEVIRAYEMRAAERRRVEAKASGPPPAVNEPEVK
ncbi:MAG: PhoH family protein [Deltaproteobacteria bacterium]|nr:PhoH family protein [Deltaproteobacteria bacterium]